MAQGSIPPTSRKDDKAVQTFDLRAGQTVSAKRLWRLRPGTRDSLFSPWLKQLWQAIDLNEGQLVSG